MSRWKLGDVKLRDIEAALDVEEAALSQIHMAVTKQLTRLEVEENMLKLLMSKLDQEAAGEIAGAHQSGKGAGNDHDTGGHDAPPSDKPGDELEEKDAGEGSKGKRGKASQKKKSSSDERATNAGADADSKKKKKNTPPPPALVDKAGASGRSKRTKR